MSNQSLLYLSLFVSICVHDLFQCECKATHVDASIEAVKLFQMVTCFYCAVFIRNIYLRCPRAAYSQQKQHGCCGCFGGEVHMDRCFDGRTIFFCSGFVVAMTLANYSKIATERQDGVGKCKNNSVCISQLIFCW